MHAHLVLRQVHARRIGMRRMLGLALCATALLLGATVSRAATVQIAAKYTFQNVYKPYAPSRVDANITASDISADGFGSSEGVTSILVKGVNGYKTYHSYYFNNASITDQGALTFTLTPESGHRLSLTNFLFDFIGPKRRKATLSYSLDEGATFTTIGSRGPSCFTDLGACPKGYYPNRYKAKGISLSSLPSLTRSVTFQLSFRHGSGFSFVDNLIVQQAAPVPLPSAVWLLSSGLLGIAAIFRRKSA